VCGAYPAARGRCKKLTALLDARHGVEYEGEEPEPPTPASLVAWKAWLMLSNGMGALDWAGVEPVADLLGVPDSDFELFIDRLLLIKLYRKPGDT
jgi:hypothetical protein